MLISLRYGGCPEYVILDTSNVTCSAVSWAAPHLHLAHPVPPMGVTKQPSHTSPAHTRWEDPSSLAPCPNPWPDKSGFLQSSPRSRPSNQLQPFFRFIYGIHLRRKTLSPSLSYTLLPSTARLPQDPCLTFSWSWPSHHRRLLASQLSTSSFFPSSFRQKPALPAAWIVQVGINLVATHIVAYAGRECPVAQVCRM